MVKKYTLYYREGYKGQVAETLPAIQTPIRPENDIDTEFIKLTKDGLLTILKGYAYDFASGPTLDWPEYVKAITLFHDAFCQLHAEGHLNDEHRKQADQWFKDGMMLNGRWLWLRWRLWYRGVRIGAKDGSESKPVHRVKFKLPEE